MIRYNTLPFGVTHTPEGLSLILSGLVGALGASLLSGVSTLGAGALNAANSEALQNHQFAAQQGLNAQQHYLNELSAGKADERTRQLYMDSAAMQKQALQNAGINVGSMMQGYSNAQATSNMATAGNGSAGIASQSPYGIPDFSTLADIELKQSQANLNNKAAEKTAKETNWMDDEKAAQIYKTVSEIDKNAVDMHRLRTEAEYNIKRSELTEEQKQIIEPNIKNIEEQTQQIRLNNAYIAKINDANLEEIGSRIKLNFAKIAEAGSVVSRNASEVQLNEEKGANLRSQSELNDVKTAETEIRNDMAQLGFGVSHSWVESIAILAQHDHGIFSGVMNTILDGLAEFSEDISGRTAARKMRKYLKQ